MKKMISFLLFALVELILASCDSAFTKPRRFYSASDIVDENDNYYKTYYADNYTKEQLAAIYFVETFYFRYNYDEYTSKRITKDPYFWFSSAHNSDGAGVIRQLLSEGVDKLTGGRFQAHFLTDTSGPAAFDTSKLYVEVRIVGSAADGSAEYNYLSDGSILRAKIAISSQYETLKDDTYLPRMRTVVFHELGHLLGGATHSGLVGNIMTYNTSFVETNVFPDYELEAWDMFFSLPPNTSLAEVKASGLLKDFVEPKPFVSSIEIENVGQVNQNLPIKAGDKIILYGSNLYLDYGCAGIKPTNDIVIKIGSLTLTHIAPTTSVKCTTAMEATVPNGVKSGFLTITRDGRESFPFYVNAK